MREAYRLQKNELQAHLHHRNIFLDVFFIYTGKELPDYNSVSKNFNQSLKKLQTFFD
jgi:hypothetical protein